MNAATDFLKDLTGIVTLLIGVALIALLVGHAANTSALIQSSTAGLNTLLNTVELSNSVQNVPYSPANPGPIGGGSGGGMFGSMPSMGGSFGLG